MKQLLTFIFTALIFGLSAQYSDTSTCVSGLDTLSYVINYDQQQCTDSCDGSYSIQILNGVGPFTYQVGGDMGFSSTLAAEDSLCPESFVCIVTDIGTGILCTAQFSVDSVQIISHSIALTHVVVSGQCTGEAELTITGGVPPYIVTWYDSNQVPIPNESGITLDSLCAGNYYYRFLDSSPGCCDTCTAGFGPGVPLTLIPFTINEEIIVSVDFTIGEMCEFMCDGLVQLSATGGTGNYTYDIGFQTNSNGFFDNLCPNFYIVTVTDDNGNIGQTSFEIEWAYPPFVQVTYEDEVCEGTCNGSITIEDFGGDLVEFSIDGINFFPSPIFTGLCPDVYIVYVRNWNFCESLIQTVVIGAGTSPTINTISTSMPSSPSATDGCIVAVNATGGSPGYVYTIDGQPLPIPNCSFPIGTYEVCVEDVLGCMACADVTLISCGLTVEEDSTAISCSGFCDGSADVTVTNSNGAYSTTWVNSQGNSVGNNDLIENLCSDTYSYVVSDAAGCVVEGSVTIASQEPIFVITTVVNGTASDTDCSGAIDAVDTGGSDGLVYSWYECGTGDNISNSPNATGLCPGGYYVVAMDLNDCEYTSNCITIQDVTAIKELSQTTWSVYPNPSHNEFNITVDYDGDFIYKIINIEGKLLLEENSNSKTFSINVRDFEDGIYFIELDIDGTKLVQRVIVN